MTTATLERPTKPCGCSEASLGQKVRIMDGITNAGAGGQRVHIQESTGNWAVGRVSQTVHIRGEVEEPCDCGITDSFTRTDAGPQMWGFADIGNLDSGAGEWTLTDANVGTTMDWEATVEGTYGRLWVEGGAGNPALARARLYDLGIEQTFRLTFRVKFVTFDTVTETVYVDFEVRFSAGSTLGARLNFTLGDGIYLSSEGVAGTTSVAFDPTPDTWYQVLFEQDADDELRVKVWEDGDTEPGSWTLTKDVSTQDDWTGVTEFRIDAGQVNSGDPGTPDLEVHVDDLDIVGVEGCVFDNFNRTAAGSWSDTTPTNVTWVEQNNVDATASVAGGYGIATCLAPTADLWMDLEDQAQLGNIAFTMTMRFRTGAAIPTGVGSDVDALVFMQWYAGVDSVTYIWDVSAALGEIRVRNDNTGGGDASVAKTDWVVDTDYIVRVHQDPATNAVKLKIWEAADTEPVGWDIETTLTDIDLTDATPTIEFGISTITTATYVHKIDYIMFNDCPLE